MGSYQLILPPVPDFGLLEELRRQGFEKIIGVDEVGRGALAGPIVVAAVEIWRNFEEVNDSKLVKRLTRLSLAQSIKTAASQLRIGIVDNLEIDNLGIATALNLAYKRALKNLKIDLILTDNYRLPGFKHFQAPKGDKLFYPVAAASIVAKVYRDQIMRAYDKFFPEYGWQTNVGYGTVKHLETIKEHGPCALHRKSFCKKIC